MKVNGYQIGRYHGILRKDYSDNTHDYETSFSDEADIYCSIRALTLCIGNEIGIATDEPKTLVKVSMFRGRADIEQELTANG